jgi:exopolysaccharide biosynthesis polyprenyl glycosylphosphotransferase
MAELHESARIDDTLVCRDQLRIAKYPFLSTAIIFKFSDFMAVLALPLAGSFLRQTTENLQRNFCFWILLSVFTVILIASHGGYRMKLGVATPSQTGLAINCFLATSIAMLSMSILLGHGHILVRHWTIADLALTPVIIGFARLSLTKQFNSHTGNVRAAGPLIICYDHCPSGLRRALTEQRISTQIAGILFLAPPASATTDPSLPKLSDSHALLRALQLNNIQDVVFIHHAQLDAFATTEHQELLSELLTYPARIWLAFDVAANLPDMLKSHSGTCKIVPIITDDLVSSLNLTKRVIDIVGSITLLFIVSPILLIAAGLVKLSGPGPIIFRQIRIGAQGQKFNVLKLRTMADEPGMPFSQARENDPRVTKIGRFLRRSSLDELLQLFNVIQGDMSLVGPRPHSPETEVEGISFENAVRLYRLRHRVKPGITGLAQIRGQRGETPAISMLEQRLASDLEYIQSWSLWLDISILMQTLPAVIAATNAC